MLVSRFGLLTMFTANFVYTLNTAMMTTDLSAWYAKTMILSFLTIIFLLGYGFKISITNQPLFGGRTD
ncbi:MAG: hypothetical protein K1X72_23675 [Pyrinomonadaceae bacterium]|nr:hypothetical protein [Pyrinomonadaceae bacterium]